MRKFYDPPPEKVNVRLIESRTLHEAERLIESCEHCNPDGAEIPFEGSDSSVTDYGLETPAKCPNCRRDILEKTLLNLLKCASSSSACPLAST